VDFFRKLTLRDWGIIAASFAVALIASGITNPSVKNEDPVTQAEEPVSNDQLVSPEELKAAGDRIAAEAKDFGSDCEAAEAHFVATGDFARCKMEGTEGISLEVIISGESLPPDPALKDAE
jgi:hypothetical protein